MGKGRSFKTQKEHTRERELSHKNKHLQREIARLKRENEKLMFLLDRERVEEEVKSAKEMDVRPKVKDRTCYHCGDGKLKKVEYNKGEARYYYRSCDRCDHRTRPKKVEGDVLD